MKKIFLTVIFALFCATGVVPVSFARDVIPVRPDVTQTGTIGMYQVSDDVQVYKEPDENSQILYRMRWTNDEFFPEEIGFDNFFVVFLPKKSLALVYVTDFNDDWVEIVYDKSTGKTGWIKKDDPYKLMTWLNFYNTYGKKYGLVLLKSSPDSCKDIKSQPDDKAQTISNINHPVKINLNVLRGNWALVSVYDLDHTPKTGYIRWRSDDGVRYFFPMLKENF